MCLLGVQGPGVHMLGWRGVGRPPGAGTTLPAVLTPVADRHWVKTVVNGGVRP